MVPSRQLGEGVATKKCQYSSLTPFLFLRILFTSQNSKTASKPVGGEVESTPRSVRDCFANISNSGHTLSSGPLTSFSSLTSQKYPTKADSDTAISTTHHTFRILCAP